MLALSVVRVLFYSFARIFIVLFARVFVRAFVIFTCVSLTIVISIVFIPNLLLICTCDYIFVGNFCTLKIHIICVQAFKSIFQDLKLLCVLCNE